MNELSGSGFREEVAYSTDVSNVVQGGARYTIDLCIGNDVNGTRSRIIARETMAKTFPRCTVI